MAFEDQYLDVLQNIEFAIISVYRQQQQFPEGREPQERRQERRWLFVNRHATLAL